jgi:hypothetical protein
MSTATGAESVAVIDWRRIAVEDRPPEFWRELELAQLRFAWVEWRDRKRGAWRLYDQASYTLRGDPDATDADRQEAKVQERCALSGVTQCEAKMEEIEQEAERAKSTPQPVNDRPPAAAQAPALMVRVRSLARPRECRPGRRRRAVARAGPDDPDLADLPDRRGAPA